MSGVDPQTLRDRIAEADRRDQTAIDCYDQALAELGDAVDRLERARDNVERQMRLRRERLAGRAAPEVWEWVWEPGDHVTAVRCDPHGDGECPGLLWIGDGGRWQTDGKPALPWPNLLYAHSPLRDATGEVGDGV